MWASASILASVTLVISVFAPTATAAPRTDPPPRITIGTQHLFPDSSKLGDDGFIVNARNLTDRLTATLTRRGETIWTDTLTSASIDNIPVPAATVRSWKAGRYSLTLTSGDLTKKVTVRVHTRWAPLFSSNGEFTPAGFPRCSTITWAYSAKKEPQGVRSVVADLKVVFDRYEALTGLSLKKVRRASSADIVVNWDDIDYADGIGGSSWDGRNFTAGSVTLSTSSSWARTPGFGYAGRGGLLFHELGHVFGLGHVRQKKTLMHEISYVGSTRDEPGKAEIKGLRYLYRPNSCN